MQAGLYGAPRNCQFLISALQFPFPQPRRILSYLGTGLRFTMF
jgi:hypothetical protein